MLEIEYIKRITFQKLILNLKRKITYKNKNII